MVARLCNFRLFRKLQGSALTRRTIYFVTFVETVKSLRFHSLNIGLILPSSRAQFSSLTQLSVDVAFSLLSSGKTSNLFKFWLVTILGGIESMNLISIFSCVLCRFLYYHSVKFERKTLWTICDRRCQTSLLS